jgi:hypothetical protein
MEAVNRCQASLRSVSISGCCLVASTRERKEREKEADGEDEYGVK